MRTYTLTDEQVGLVRMELALAASRDAEVKAVLDTLRDQWIDHLTAPLEPQRPKRAFAMSVPSDSDPERQYVVSYSSVTGYCCTCPDFFHRTAKTTCKHIDRVIGIVLKERD